MSRNGEFGHVGGLRHLSVSGSVDGLNAGEKAVVDFGFSMDADAQNHLLKSFAGVGESQGIFLGQCRASLDLD